MIFTALGYALRAHQARKTFQAHGKQEPPPSYGTAGVTAASKRSRQGEFLRTKIPEIGSSYTLVHSEWSAIRLNTGNALLARTRSVSGRRTSASQSPLPDMKRMFSSYLSS